MQVVLQLLASGGENEFVDFLQGVRIGCRMPNRDFDAGLVEGG
jgi:hypothetical protein